MMPLYPPSRLLKAKVMSRAQRTVYMAMMSFGLLLTGLFGVWWFQPSHIPVNFSGWGHIADFSLFAILSYIVWHQIVSEVFNWMVAKDMSLPYYMFPKPGMRVAMLTTFVPGKEPYDILEKSLKAMVGADYPHDTWLLDEGNDPIAKQICAQLGVKHFSRKGFEYYNQNEGQFKAKTKGGNHNSWHHRYGHNYDIVAQMDVDFIPRKDFLTKTLGYFTDPTVAFVGSPQIYGNTDESWIAQGAAEQAYGFYGVTQKGFFGKDMHLIIGANHVVRVAALNSVRGYSGHIVEDHLTGMNLYTKKWKSVYIPEKLAIGEGPATWDAYFSQQMRWAYGLIDILFKHSPRLLPKMKFKHALNYYFLQQHYFYGLVQALGIGLITLYFTLGIQSSNMKLLPLLIMYVPLVLWQLLITTWLQRFHVDPETESGWLWKGRILTVAAWPIYLLAFIGVLRNKRLTYAVTPKGNQQVSFTPLKLFIPHMILGTMTAIDVLIAFANHSDAGLLIFWAIVNTVFMYGFIGLVVKQRLAAYVAARQTVSE